MSALEALQDCLAAEHAAVYGYGVVGGVLAGATAAESPDQDLAAAAYAEHRRRRDDLRRLITDAGGDPVAAEPAYALPEPVKGLGDCRAVARLLEDRCSQVYADAVSRTVHDERALVARALTACTLRGVAWGGRIEPFPGIAEF